MKLTHRDTGDTIEVPDEGVDVYRKAGWEPDDDTSDPPATSDGDTEADEATPETKGRKPRT